MCVDVYSLCCCWPGSQCIKFTHYITAILLISACTVKGEAKITHI